MDRDGSKRGPLRAVILARTGEDVRLCTSCWHCEQERVDGMDLSFGDIMRAAAQDDPLALKNETLWNCDSVVERNPVCPSGIDRSLVIEALREEARMRGYGQATESSHSEGKEK